MTRAKKKRLRLSKDDFYRTLDEQVPGGIEVGANAPLNNSSLYFTRVSMDGLEEMFEYSKDTRFYEYFEYEPHVTIDDTKQYLEKLISRIGRDVMGRSAMYWFARRLSDNRMVGTGCLVDINFDRQSVEWGYGVDPSLWGEGHILEMTELLKSYVFETLAMNRLFGKAMMVNERTRSSLLGSGMQEEGVLRQFYYTPRTGSYHDAWAYSMLAEDYFPDEEKGQRAVFETDSEATLPSVSSVKEVVCVVLNVGNLSPNADMATIPAWDSISHLEVVIAVEKKFACKFLPPEVGRARSISIIHEMVIQKLQAP